jgi:hypothetical protein
MDRPGYPEALEAIPVANIDEGHVVLLLEHGLDTLRGYAEIRTLAGRGGEEVLVSYSGLKWKHRSSRRACKAYPGPLAE